MLPSATGRANPLTHGGLDGAQEFPEEDRDRDRRRRSGAGGGAERDRAAAIPVAHVHDVDARARRPAGRRAEDGEDHRRDERRAAEDPGVRRRRADAALRLLRRLLAGHNRVVHGRAVLLGGQGRRLPVVLGRALRPQPERHDGVVPLRRRPQAVGRGLRAIEPRAALPADLKAIVDHACQAVQVISFQEYEYKNTVALQKLKTDFKSKVELVRLSDAILKDLKKLADQVIKEESEKTPTAKKAYASINKFEKEANDWRLISEAAYHAQVAAI